MKFIVQDFAPKPVGLSSQLIFCGADAPEKIYQFYREHIETDDGYEPEKEHTVVICLDSRMAVTGWHMVAVGTLTECLCHPREILRPVIVRCAHGFVLCHNHPSGDPSPGNADQRITTRIKESAALLRIPLIDHVIVGRPSPGRTPYYSFREAGLI